MVDFEWPWQYSFPPFFTLQPNLDTRKKQIDGWSSLILAYHKHGKKYTLDITEAESSPLFYNKKMDRKLSPEAIECILEELRKKGHVEWTDNSRKRCLVMWRTPAEWGKLIYKWIQDRGMNNSVCTFYEITEGDDSENQEFHGLDGPILMLALKSLEKQHKAEIMGEDGVKFF